MTKIKTTSKRIRFRRVYRDISRDEEKVEETEKRLRYLGRIFMIPI
ncbi:hypothetical protein ACFLZZ_03670 [Nanoarchaeota archaeon]